MWDGSVGSTFFLGDMVSDMHIKIWSLYPYDRNYLTEIYSAQLKVERIIFTQHKIGIDHYAVGYRCNVIESMATAGFGPFGCCFMTGADNCERWPEYFWYLHEFSELREMTRVFLDISMNFLNCERWPEYWVFLDISMNFLNCERWPECFWISPWIFCSKSRAFWNGCWGTFAFWSEILADWWTCLRVENRTSVLHVFMSFMGLTGVGWGGVG